MLQLHDRKVRRARGESTAKTHPRMIGMSDASHTREPTVGDEMTGESSLKTAMSHVLLVDGNPNFRKTLNILLSDAGYLVDEAADTEHCAELLSRRCYAVVITDLCVERGDGLDVLWS